MTDDTKKQPSRVTHIRYSYRGLEHKQPISIITIEKARHHLLDWTIAIGSFTYCMIIKYENLDIDIQRRGTGLIYIHFWHELKVFPWFVFNVDFLYLKLLWNILKARMFPIPKEDKR